MKKKEAPRSVPAIQFLDPSGHDVDIFCVLRHALSRRVSKIGQERKTQIRIRISEVRISRRLSSFWIASGVVNNSGTTTSVRQSSGMPSFLKYILRKTWGGKSEVTK